MHVQFVKLNTIMEMNTGEYVDVVGVVDQVDPPSQISRKDGSEVEKRSMRIVDDSNNSIELTLWGAFVTEPGNMLEAAVAAGSHPVVAVKGVRIGDFGGKNLSTVGTSVVAANPPDVPQAVQLQTWSVSMLGCSLNYYCNHVSAVYTHAYTGISKQARPPRSTR